MDGGNNEAYSESLGCEIRMISFIDLLLAFAYQTHSHPTTSTGTGPIMLIAYPTQLSQQVWF